MSMTMTSHDQLTINESGFSDMRIPVFFCISGKPIGTAYRTGTAAVVVIIILFEWNGYSDSWTVLWTPNDSKKKASTTRNH